MIIIVIVLMIVIVIVIKHLISIIAQQNKPYNYVFTSLV